MSSAPGTRYADCLPATWLAARLAVDPTKIDVLRRSGELIAVRQPGSTEWLYPAWQFEAWKPRRGVTRIVAAAREAGVDETQLYNLLTTTLGLTGRRRLVDVLHEGREDEVVAAIRAG